MPVVDDDFVEFDEIFFGNLGLPTPDTTGILFDSDRATATIADNDCKQKLFTIILIIYSSCPG